MTRLVRSIALPLALAAALTACSSDAPAADAGGQTPSASTGAGAGASSATLVADKISWDTNAISAAVGSFTLTVDNQNEGIPHNVHVTGNGLDKKTEIANGPDKQTLTLNLDAGTYDYICDVHSNMTGTITAA